MKRCPTCKGEINEQDQIKPNIYRCSYCYSDINEEDLEEDDENISSL